MVSAKKIAWLQSTGRRNVIGTPRSELKRWERELAEGTDILRTNVATWSHEEQWKSYIQLTEAEAASRIHKTDLAIRPVRHHMGERIRAYRDRPSEASRKLIERRNAVKTSGKKLEKPRLHWLKCSSWARFRCKHEQVAETA